MTKKKEPVGKKKKGAPSKFETSIEKIKMMSIAGFTDKQMADTLEITEATFNNWKKRNADFFESLKDWKKFADANVKQSLYKRATGYKVKEETYELIVDYTQTRRHKDTSTIADLTEEQWKIAKSYFKHRCAYCDSTVKLTKDHILALAHGGDYSMPNIIPACQACNSSKGKKDMEIWFMDQDFFDAEKLWKIEEYQEFAEDVLQTTTQASLTLTKVVTKETPPDTQAIRYWLNNRQPEEWKDRRYVDMNAKVETTPDKNEFIDAMDKLSKDENKNVSDPKEKADQ